MKRPAIKDVAARAGVSRAAVSKVIRDAYGVSDAMRQRVQAAMDELNYRPSPGAQGLRGSTFTLGVLVPDIRNWFFPDILDGVAKELEGSRYQSLLGIGQSEVNNEQELVETMLARKMDGLIMISPQLSFDYVRRIAQTVPTVFIGRHQSGEGFDTVNNDDERGARAAVQHLARLGHERIAHIHQHAGEEPHTPPGMRFKGYVEEMKALGLAPIMQRALRPVSARAAMIQLMQGAVRPTSLFAWTDNIAFSAMSVVEEMGLRIPEDLSLVGYDNSSICDMHRIMLTSVDQSGHLLGEMAARLLIERIEGRSEEVHFVTPPRLVIRDSTAVAR